MKEIKLDLTFLRPFQKEFFKNAKRFNVLVCHRRFGKTVLSVIYLLYKALKDQGLYGYIAPTYRQSKGIAFDILRKFAEKIPETKINISELTIKLCNGSKIKLFGADYPDRLKGLDIRGCVFDEFAQQPASIYTEVIFPMINANNGWVIWIGTPKGKNNFYNLYEKAKLDEKYYTMLYSITDTGLLSEEQIKQAKEEMSEDEYNQEYMCSWEASIQGAYYSKEIQEIRKLNQITKLPEEKQLDVNTYWDLGLNDTNAIRFIQFIGKEIRVIDHYEASGEGLAHYIRMLKDKNYNYGTHYLPFDANVRELQSGISRKDFLINSGLSNIKIVPKIGIDEGIEAVRRILKYCRFNEEKCYRGLEALTQYHKEYDTRNKIYNNKPKHDWSSNSADAFRYFAISHKTLTTIPQNNNRQKTYWNSLLGKYVEIKN